MTKNMYTVAGDGPCNEELALRMQAGDKNAAERLVLQNEGYLTDLVREYTPLCPFPSAGTINCAGWHTSAPRDGTHLMLSWSRWCAEN